jgi:hypothetical protein
MPARITFAAFVLVALVISFALGHWTGRMAVHEHYKRFAPLVPTEDRVREAGKAVSQHRLYFQELAYHDLRRAVEEHREQAPAEQRPAIDECLRELRSVI